MEITYDLAILGGGPAGVAAGVYASRKRLKTIFITKDFQGQSAVSDGVENWIGTVKIHGAELSKNLEEHLRTYAESYVDIKTGEYIELINQLPTGEFSINTNKNTYLARTVLVTTGSHRRKMEVKGADVFEHKGVTYCASCDGPMFADQDVVVIGGGNAAFESAAQLLAYCRSVTLLNRSSTFRADPVTVEKVLKHPKMRAIRNAIPKEVKGEKFAASIVYTDDLSKKDIEIPASGIFVEIGSIPTTSFVKSMITLDPYGRIPVDPRNQRALSGGSWAEGIWAAGDCTDGLYHQNNIAAGDAIKALEDIYIYLHTK